MRAHAIGMNVLGGETPVRVEFHTPWWHHAAVFVGALASVATLWVAFRGRR
jgi:membrane protein YdbS with pleckstrin-like domain